MVKKREHSREGWDGQVYHKGPRCDWNDKCISKSDRLPPLGFYLQRLRPEPGCEDRTEDGGRKRERVGGGEASRVARPLRPWGGKEFSVNGEDDSRVRDETETLRYPKLATVQWSSVYSTSLVSDIQKYIHIDAHDEAKNGICSSSEKWQEPHVAQGTALKAFYNETSVGIRRTRRLGARELFYHSSADDKEVRGKKEKGFFFKKKEKKWQNQRNVGGNGSAYLPQDIMWPDTRTQDTRLIPPAQLKTEL